MEQGKQTSKCSDAPLMSGRTCSQQQQHRPSSRYLRQSQQSTGQPQPSHSHIGAGINNAGMICAYCHNSGETAFMLQFHKYIYTSFFFYNDIYIMWTLLNGSANLWLFCTSFPSCGLHHDAQWTWAWVFSGSHVYQHDPTTTSTWSSEPPPSKWIKSASGKHYAA